MKSQIQEHIEEIINQIGEARISVTKVYTTNPPSMRLKSALVNMKEARLKLLELIEMVKTEGENEPCPKKQCSCRPTCDSNENADDKN